MVKLICGLEQKKAEANALTLQETTWESLMFPGSCGKLWRNKKLCNFPLALNTVISIPDPGPYVTCVLVRKNSNSWRPFGNSKGNGSLKIVRFLVQTKS